MNDIHNKDYEMFLKQAETVLVADVYFVIPLV
jgi:hypothetical protein